MDTLKRLFRVQLVRIEPRTDIPTSNDFALDCRRFQCIQKGHGGHRHIPSTAYGKVPRQGPNSARIPESDAVSKFTTGKFIIHICNAGNQRSLIN